MSEIKPVAWMCPVDKGDGPDISCNWEYASLFKGKAIPLYTADALAAAREEGRLEMRAELAAAQKDADRYRWLQNAYVYSESIGEWVRSLSAREFDAAIDAAMAQEKRDERR